MEGNHITPSAAKPQPKSKQTFHHEGREVHEGKNKFYFVFFVFASFATFAG